MGLHSLSSRVLHRPRKSLEIPVPMLQTRRRRLHTPVFDHARVSRDTDLLDGAGLRSADSIGRRESMECNAEMVWDWVCDDDSYVFVYCVRAYVVMLGHVLQEGRDKI